MFLPAAKLLITSLTVALLLATQAHGLSLDDTCKNGGQLKVMFWQHLPYVTSSKDGSACGIFPDVLKKMVDACCHEKVELSFKAAKGSAEFFTTIEDLGVNRNAPGFDLAMPLHITEYGKTSFETQPFVAIVESFGIAVLKHSNISTTKLMTSLFQAWPVLLFIVITAAIAGIVMWFVEKQANSKQFSPSFPLGAFDGFWWAFVSMTSVGYGDKYPKSIIGKIMGSTWIVLGMLFVTMFIGTLTTTLMTLLLETTYNIQDQKISVVNGSNAHWLGISHHANVQVVGKQEDLYSPLIHYKVDAALVDINSLKDVVHNLQKQHNIRVIGVLPKETFYGVVLRKNSANLTNCFRKFLEKHEDSIYQKLADYSGTQKNNLDPAEDYFGSGGIFSISVYSMMALFITLCISGGLWELHKYHTNKYLKETEIEDQETVCPASNLQLNGLLRLETASTSFDGFRYACQCNLKNNAELGTLYCRSKQSEV